MADGGIGEAALMSEAGGGIGGGIAGSAAADAGAEFGTDAAFNAANTASLGSEFGTPEAFNAYNSAQMNLSSPEAANLASMPSGPGVPKSAALNASQQAVTAANQAAQQNAATALNMPPPAAAQSVGSQFNPSTAGLPGSSFNGPPSAISNGTISGELGQAGSSSSPFSSMSNLWNSASNWAQQNPKQAMALGGAAGIYALMKSGAMKPNYMTPFQPQTAQQVGLGKTLSPQYRPTFAAAKGGVTSLAMGGVPGQQYPMSEVKYNGYNTPTQMPTSAMQMAGYQPTNTPLAGALQQNMASGGAASSSGTSSAGESNGNLNIWHPTQQSNNNLQSLAAQYGINLPSGMADGGVTSLASGGAPGYNLGGYSDGGRLLKGPGDGMSDDIPASIAHKQPARLADGEFVVPADVVSHLGNGSTDAGAKHLYAMMDKVRKARTGNSKQGKQIKAEKYLPV